MSNVKKWEEEDHWVEIDLALCTGIGSCSDVCPAGVYTVIDKKVNGDNIEECIMCGACQGICFNKAILRHWAW
jgi:NAD-dependent dihydropyrimidine dehydrogenase PreA subunit